MAGVEALRPHCSVLVIVDVLSFSTAVDIATSRGALVYPFPFGDTALARAEANRHGAELALPRSTAGGQFSLSPASLLRIPEGTKLVLPSPNGSRLSRSSGDMPVIAGCLRNAASVAKLARSMAGDRSIGIIAAGERWPDGGLRPAIEDLLGAGAIIGNLGGPCCAEAEVARSTYLHLADRIGELIQLSISGRELISMGFERDVDLACEVNVSHSAPILKDGAFCSSCDTA